MKLPKQHGVGSYNKGCRCESCKQAKRLAARRVRAGRYGSRQREGRKMCVYCSSWFNPRGIGSHQRACGAK